MDILIPNGIVQKCTFLWYQEKHVSTCKISTKVSHNVPLPHFGSLWRSLSAHEATMTLKIILCQRFGESISNLILGIDREDLDESLSHMFTKMMVTHIDVLGPRAKLGQPCQFKGARVVLKNLAKNIRFSAKDLETPLPHFLQ